MNFVVTFANSARRQYLGETDSYSINDAGVLTLDVTEEGKRIRLVYGPSGWLEVRDLNP